MIRINREESEKHLWCGCKVKAEKPQEALLHITTSGLNQSHVNICVKDNSFYSLQM